LYNTLQMGSYFKKAIFDEHVQQGLVGWAQKVKKRTAQKAGNGSAIAAEKPHAESAAKIEMNLLTKLNNGRQNGES
jgi:mlo protein